MLPDAPSPHLPGREVPRLEGVWITGRLATQTSGALDTGLPRHLPAVLLSSSMVIAFAGQKGGSGKTTTAIAVAAEWVSRGRKVLLVDADPQGSARTWGEVALENGHPSPTVVAMGAGLHRAEQLPALAGSYDVTVVDCPPRHGEIQRAALMVADIVVLPCGPSAMDAWALGESLELVQKAMALRPELKAAVLITRRVARTVLGAGAREALRDCGLPVLKAELRHRVTFQEAPAAGQGPTSYAPTSPAADEVRALVEEIERLVRGEERPERRSRAAAHR